MHDKVLSLDEVAHGPVLKNPSAFEVAIHGPDLMEEEEEEEDDEQKNKKDEEEEKEEGQRRRR